MQNYNELLLRLTNIKPLPAKSCPACGAEMVKMKSKFKKGEFWWACSNYRITGCKGKL